MHGWQQLQLGRGYVHVTRAADRLWLLVPTLSEVCCLGLAFGAASWLSVAFW